MRAEALVRRQEAGSNIVRKIFPEVQPAGAEITVLQTNVDVFADGRPDPGNRLKCPGAVAVTKCLYSRAADAKSSISAEARITAEVAQDVDHAGDNPDPAVNVEIVSVDVVRISAYRFKEVVVELNIVGPGAFVAKLAFNPERTEVEAGDSVQIKATIELDLGDIVFQKVRSFGILEEELAFDVHVLRE